MLRKDLPKFKNFTYYFLRWQYKNREFSGKVMCLNEVLYSVKNPKKNSFGVSEYKDFLSLTNIK